MFSRILAVKKLGRNASTTTAN